MSLLVPFLTLIVMSSLSTSLAVDTTNGGIDRWCKNTPHPKPCSYYLAHSPRPAVPKDKSDFYKLSVHAALDRTLGARNQLLGMGRRCRRKKLEKNAWTDCVKLYENTVIQLNRTLHPPNRRPCTDHDAQTWLSAALTNLAMCRKIFVVLGVSLEIISPLASYNVSDLISNCLAINKPPAGTTTARAGFPGWTTSGDRKLLQVPIAAAPNNADLVVAKDGSGDFRTVGDAVTGAAKMKRNGRRLVIHVKAGVYNENVQITSSVTDLTLVGDGKGRTIISGSNSVIRGFTLITSATLAVFGDGFIARDMTIRNTFGTGSQALALLLASDRSVIYRCSIEGYQDTLCVFSQRQFYRECDVHGTIDFIFGNAAAVLQNCSIYVRRPRAGEANVITAQGRSDPNQNTGIVIQFCNIRSSAEFWPVHRRVRTFLGRPWMRYSRTVYLQNYLDRLIDPSGWMPWNGDFALSTLYYAEFKNRGPGSRMSRRVKWPGYHVIVKRSLVFQFTVANFIAGGMWLPSTGMPFASGL